ncbi:hypothetical protein H0H92_008334 [Tricholoma furcatifolium]|nr:hypothetical protein H0H92_008334 [Tricholoma furcatifolium]
MYIAVHGGAGMHSPSREKEVKHALRLACREALQNCINQDESSCTPLDVTGDAIALLEDDPHLNAGYGSNLTLDGTVECDAAIMDSSLSFGSVGAVAGVKNPIRLARAILDYSKVPDPLGRIPPLTLVSSGAHSFAMAEAQRGIVDTVPAESMISQKAKDNWIKWKARLYGEIPSDGMEESASLSDIQDTVGAVAFRNGEPMAAGVSRLAVWEIARHLKTHSPHSVKSVLMDEKAAVFGAGCWAQEFPKAGIKIACSLSGGFND